MTEVMIRDEFAYDCADQPLMAGFARACVAHGIPTGVGIPLAAAKLAERAYFQGQPRLWDEARGALTRETNAAVMGSLFGVTPR